MAAQARDGPAARATAGQQQAPVRQTAAGQQQAPATRAAVQIHVNDSTPASAHALLGRAPHPAAAPGPAHSTPAAAHDLLGRAPHTAAAPGPAAPALSNHTGSSSGPSQALGSQHSIAPASPKPHPKVGRLNRLLLAPPPAPAPTDHQSLSRSARPPTGWPAVPHSARQHAHRAAVAGVPGDGCTAAAAGASGSAPPRQPHSLLAGGWGGWWAVKPRSGGQTGHGLTTLWLFCSASSCLQPPSPSVYAPPPSPNQHTHAFPFQPWPLLPPSVAPAPPFPPRPRPSLLQGRPLHPKLDTLDPHIYPSYRVQHGLSPGLAWPKPQPQSLWRRLRAWLGRLAGAWRGQTPVGRMPLPAAGVCGVEWVVLGGAPGAGAGERRLTKPFAGCACVRGPGWIWEGLHQEAHWGGGCSGLEGRLSECRGEEAHWGGGCCGPEGRLYVCMQGAAPRAPGSTARAQGGLRT